jgi:hypothetical protein
VAVEWCKVLKGQAKEEGARRVHQSTPRSLPLGHVQEVRQRRREGDGQEWCEVERRDSSRCRCNRYKHNSKGVAKG